MAPGGTPEQASIEGEMVWGEVTRVLDSQCLEEAKVRTKDIIAAQMKQFILLDLPPRLSVVEPQPLHKMSEESHQLKGVQKVFHLFIPGILNPVDTRIQVSH